jgi:hypothetical protein
VPLREPNVSIRSSAMLLLGKLLTLFLLSVLCCPNPEGTITFVNSQRLNTWPLPLLLPETTVGKSIAKQLGLARTRQSGAHLACLADYTFAMEENAMSFTTSTGNSAPTLVEETTGAGGDLCLTEVESSRILLIRILNWYLANLTICAQHNSSAVTAIHNVVRFAASPQTLLEPRLVARVLSTALSRRVARNRSQRLDATAKGAF